jgi:hypothetical protein
VRRTQNECTYEIPVERGLSAKFIGSNPRRVVGSNNPGGGSARQKKNGDDVSRRRFSFRVATQPLSGKGPIVRFALMQTSRQEDDHGEDNRKKHGTRGRCSEPETRVRNRL